MESTKKSAAIYVAALLTALFFFCGCFGSGSPESSGVDTVYINGTVLTINATDDVVEAVAVKGDRITKVGTSSEIRALAGSNTQVVDLEGKTVMPGFIDAHSHFLYGGDLALYTVALMGPPIGTVGSMADIIDKMSAEATTVPAGEWLVGTGYDDSLLAENRHPTRDDLDQISTEHPIFLWHSSQHIVVINSLALSICNITKDTPQPAGGVIRKDPDTGEPNGVLEESPAWIPPYMKAFSRTTDQSLDAVAYAAENYTSHGITTAQEGAAHMNTIPALLEASGQGTLSLRVIVYPLLEYVQWMRSGTVNPDFENAEMVSLGAAKIISDGSIQGYTGYLSEPYFVQPEGESDYSGYPALEREDLVEKVKTLHEAGLQIAIHANGDAAIDNVIHAFREAQEAFPREDTRHIIIHCQMAREDQMDAMEELGIIPSFFILHTYYWGDRHTNIFMGPERASRMSPAKSAVDRKIPFTIHTDTPVVPMEPLRLVWSAVNRISTSGNTIGEAQKITPIQALRAVTINAAYQYFKEDEIGSVEADKLADLVILSDNPLTVDPMDIDNIEVEETIVGGKTVYKK